MYRNRPVSLVLVGLFVWVTACTSYTQIELAEVADHGKVRVTLTDGERATIRESRVEADSIKGLAEKNKALGVNQDRAPWAIPLDQVAALEAVGTDEVATVFTVLGVVVLVGAVLLTACLGSSDYSCSF